jgi:hypothetical protein
MAVAKKDRERAGYAWMYGAQARKDGKDGKERVAPEYWQENTDAWLQGFDDAPLAGVSKAKTVSDQMEAEIDETAVKPSGS